MKISNQLIEYAYKELKEQKIVCAEKKSYPKEFAGYISSFGAAIVQSGLLPAVIFYEETKADTKETDNLEDKEATVKKNRAKVVKAIHGIINRKRETEGKGKIESQTITQYLLDDPDGKKENDLIDDVVESVIGLKLALRIFKKEDNDGKQSE